MHGLEDIKRMNAVAESPVLHVEELPVHVRDEYGALLDAIDAAYAAGHYTLAQVIEEKAEARAIYL